MGYAVRKSKTKTIHPPQAPPFLTPKDICTILNFVPGVYFFNFVASHPFPLLHLLKPRIVGTVDHVVRKVDQKLSQAAFRGSIITKDRGKGSVSQRLWQALAESLSGTSVVTQPRNEFSTKMLLNPMNRTGYRRKHLTTCFRSRTVCCSTN